MMLSSKMMFARRLLRAFICDQRGNIAVLFSIAVLPILSFVGAAVDYTRVSTARTAMQSALDSATLMVSKDLSSGAITASDVNAKAQAYFTSLFNNKDVDSINITATYTAKDSQGNSTISVTGTGSMNTEFMKVAGYPKLDFGTASTTTWGGTRMRVALALDVTGSMISNGKLDAMKTAANKLVNTLKALGTTTDDVYISVVPFAQMVNVGSSNKGASWLNWNGLGTCQNANYSTKEGCERVGGNWKLSSKKTNWTGCVTDRDQPYDTTKDLPTNSSTDFPAVFYLYYGLDICPEELLPMTSTYTSSSSQLITDKISSLVANGGTNQAIGIEMAWQTLQQNGAFNAPSKDANYKYTDILVILSDGLNTIDRWYGNGSNPSPEVDARQTILCQNINAQVPTKTQDYIVYTIQVNTDNDPEAAVLKNCASSNGGFYSSNSAAGIADAFSSIGTSISKLRVSK